MTEELAVIEINDKTNISELRWLTKDGKSIRLRDMADSHLRNTALVLMGMGYQKYNAPEGLKILWLTALRMEWERRMEVKEMLK